jgi:hypothetical protein
VDSLDSRFLYRDSPYEIALTVLNGEAGLSTGIKLYDEDGEYLDLAGTATAADGTATITIDDEIDFDGAYTCLICVNGSKAAEFPLEVRAIGAPVPPTGTVLDWNVITSYTDTATHGPVRPGTGISNTVNADGSNTHAVAYGNSAGTAAQGNDARLSDSRTPTAHASTHATGGTDALTAANVGADPAGSAATVAGNLTAHIDDTTAAHAATAISNTPAGGIAATTVQAAINELDTEKLAVGSTAADVNPAGTAIAAALASAASAVNLTGTEPSGATQGNTRIARLATGQVAPTSIGVGAVDLQHTRTVATRSASGSGSFTAGSNNTASGAGSVALGDGNTASNFRSIALGFANTASGVNAVAMGNTNTASGEAAVCIRGATNTASGIYALAGGSQSAASGAASVADGVLTKATGTLSRATGRKAESLHDGAMVEVDNTDAVLASTLADQRTARFAGGYRWNGGDHRMEGSVFAPPKVVTTSITAELDGVYHGTAAATYTDPAPAEGRGFVVRVVNGTQTVGGTAYAAEGTVIFREYHSGAWRNRVLFGGADAAGVRATIGAAALTPTVNAQTGTTYTLAAADAGVIVTMTNGSANLLTIPTNAAVPLPVGTIANVLQGGAGITSIEGDTGVTFNGVSGGTGAITARWQGVALLKVATDTWIGSGSIGTVS